MNGKTLYHVINRIFRIKCMRIELQLGKDFIVGFSRLPYHITYRIVHECEVDLKYSFTQLI